MAGIAPDALVKGPPGYGGGKGRGGWIEAKRIYFRITLDVGRGDAARYRGSATTITGAGARRKATRRCGYPSIDLGIIDARASRGHFDAMLQPNLGKQYQSGLDEAKRQQQEERQRDRNFDDSRASRIIAE
jgi:hypothetical protein